MSSEDETNAAMPQRIDMTQFDNITSYSDGGWEVPEEDNLSKTLVADLDGSLVCSTSEMAQIEGYPLEEAQRFARIIAQLPNIVAELKRMGAKISIRGNVALIDGKTNFASAELMATDLRASVSLILAALTAKGKSIINRIYHLDRGYENIEKKLKYLGAKIKRINS